MREDKDVVGKKKRGKVKGGKELITTKNLLL
jgi:hypothetical protein